MYDKMLSERVNKLRTLKGVSARDMSLSIGQNENYINGIENGRSMPSMQGFFYICEFLEISPADFFADQVSNPKICHDILSKLNKLDPEDVELILEIINRISK